MKTLLYLVPSNIYKRLEEGNTEAAIVRGIEAAKAESPRLVLAEEHPLSKNLTDEEVENIILNGTNHDILELYAGVTIERYLSPSELELAITRGGSTGDIMYPPEALY